MEKFEKHETLTELVLHLTGTKRGSVIWKKKKRYAVNQKLIKLLQYLNYSIYSNNINHKFY